MAPRTKTTPLPKVELKVPKKHAKALPKGTEIVKETKVWTLANVTHAEALEVQTYFVAQVDEAEKPADVTKAKESLKEVRAVVKTAADTTADVLSMDLQQHPIGALVPKYRVQEMKDLVKSMKEQGYINTEPIVIFEGQILDGWHRYLASQKAKVQPVFKDYKGDDPSGQVMALNLHRRHMTDDQRSVVGGELAALDGHGPESEKSAASTVSVTASKVARAKRVSAKSDVLANAVKAGEIKLIEADRIINDPELLAQLEAGFDGELSELIEQAYETAKAVGDIKQSSTILQPRDGWTYSNVVYDSDGEELGEAWVRPLPLAIDELAMESPAFIEIIREAVGDKPDKAMIRKALKSELTESQESAIYYDFNGFAPEKGMSIAKVRGNVTKHLAEWFINPVSEDDEDDVEEVDELGDELEEEEDE